jgi:prepilin-type N-terminal cleavage/methylation domain-containing protein
MTIIAKPVRFSNQGGFSLIELSIVLVIIGLIVSGVSFGMNMQRSSEHQRIKQKFVDQWVRTYNEYYQRTGMVPGDSFSTPTFIVNANADAAVLVAILAAANAGNYLVLDGDPFDPTDDLYPARLCEGSANDSYPGARESDNTSMHDFFDSIGAKMPPGRAEGQEDRYIYLDSNGNPQELQVCFQWNPPGTYSGVGNVMILRGLTPDLARLLDSMVDGQVDAISGLFREQGRTVGDALGRDWTKVNTDSVSVDGINEDESLVKSITAHYRMNQ